MFAKRHKVLGLFATRGSVRRKSQRDAGVHNTYHPGPRAQHKSHGCARREPAKSLSIRLRFEWCGAAQSALLKSNTHAAAGRACRTTPAFFACCPLGARRRRVAGAGPESALPRQRR